MAEPARRLNEPEDDGQVYDAPGTSPSSPQLKALEGGGETTPPKHGHLREAGHEEPSRKDISDAEEGADKPVSAGPELSFYKKSSEDTSRTGLWRRTARGRGWRRKRILISLSVLLAGIAAAVAIFFALLPLKILNVVDNLQNHFYATSENAVQRETDSLFSGYVKREIFCSSGKSGIGCALTCTTNPVSCLWKSWKNNKLEDKLAKDYGIEFKKVGRNYYMKAPGLNGDGLNIDGFVDSSSSETLDEFLATDQSGQFIQVSRSELRQAVRDALSGETRWTQTMYRFKVGRFLEEKYGIKRCIIFCGTQDALADSVDAQKNAAKEYIMERVLQPREKSLAVVLKCFFSPSCEPTDTTSVPCQPDVDCELANAPENAKTDTAIREELESYSTTLGTATGTELATEEAALEKDGYVTALIKYVMENVFGQSISDATAQDLAKQISSKINAITLINMAFQLVGATGHIDTKFKKLSYLTNAPAVVSLYAMYRTYADEMKTGNANATEVGSFIDSLGPVAANADMTDLKGGTAGAEQTPLYSSLIEGHSGVGSKNYLCSNNQPPVGGSGENLVCPEERLAVNSGFLQSLQNIVNQKIPGYGVSLADIAGAWNGTIGKFIGFFGNILNWILSKAMWAADPVLNAACGLPSIAQPTFVQSYCVMKSVTSAVADKILQLATSELFPSPISENMSGGRTFDMMAAGADVSGNDFAHNGLGGQRLTNQQTANIIAQQDQQDLNRFKRESFIARIFDTNSNYSLVNKLAMAMPSSAGILQSDIASLFINPFHKLASAFTSVFSTGHVFAAATAQPDPFGVTQYGYPLDDPRLAEANKDPQAYWDANCANGKTTQAWNDDAAQASNIDPNTGMPMNTYTDPCLLIKSATGSDGGLFDSSLLTQDDLGGQ